MGSRRRAAAIASPSRVCAFSRTRSLSSSAWKVARSATPGSASFMTVSSDCSSDDARRAAAREDVMRLVQYRTPP
jgi:hypothetical protein